MFKSGFNLWTFWLTPNELFSLKRGPARVSKNSVSKGPQIIFVDCSQRIIVWNRPTKLTLRQSVIHITTRFTSIVVAQIFFAIWAQFIYQDEHSLIKSMKFHENIFFILLFYENDPQNVRSFFEEI